MSFVPYPDIDEDDFYKIIYSKKEFNKTRTGPESHARKIEDICGIKEFKLQNHQEFVRNFISPETPYNGVLLFHGTGVGKTCAAISIAEGVRNYIQKMGKKIYVIAADAIQENFKRELYNPRKAVYEKKMHAPPGSYQCAGDAFHIAEEDIPNPDARERAINNNIKKFYEFYGPGAFTNYVDIGLKKGTKNNGIKLSDEEIAEKFMNSVFIIDEAHGITGKGKLEGEKRAQARRAKQKAKEEDDVYYDDGEIKKRVVSDKTFLELMVKLIGDCHKLGGNIKLILLTATPMKDNPDELAHILQLLNYNDNRMIPSPSGKLEIFNPTYLQFKNTDDDFTFNEDYLSKAARGYISYVRGNNPITFPKALVPAEAGGTGRYQPLPRFEYGTGKDLTLIDNPYIIYPNPKYATGPLGEKVIVAPSEPYNFNLVSCEMSLYQYKIYLLVTNYFRKTVVEGKKQDDSANMMSKSVSNIAFPYSGFAIDGDINTVPNFYINLGDKEANEIVRKMFGKKGFLEIFTEDTEKTMSVTAGDDAEKTVSGKVTQPLCYKIKKIYLETFGLFMSLENPVPGREHFNLGVFSNKLASIVNNINKTQGISYAYSELDTNGGIRMLALALEANGYERYHNKKQLKERNSHLLLLNNLSDVMDKSAEYIKSRKRCTCGHIYADHLQKELDAKVRGGKREIYQECPGYEASKRRFVQAKYMIFTGDSKLKIKPHDLDPVTSESNIYGDVVKAVIGTKVTSEGIDFKWIRAVHIMDPWHNNTRIYQAIGRGIRYCSHVLLPADQRTVHIYKYVSTVPKLDIPDLDTDTGEPTNITDPEEYEELLYIGGDTDDTDAENEDPQLDVPITADGNINEDINEGEDVAITIRDILTETVDERIYRRVVTKDIKNKKLERVLKEISVDCNMNKHVNFYGDADAENDYSRDCDYDTCEYKCSGDFIPTFVDFSLKLTNTGIFFVRSLSEGVTWTKLSDFEGEPDGLKRIIDNTLNKSARFDVNLNSTDTMLQQISIVIDQLLKKIGPWRELENGDKELHFEITTDTIDKSTYNVHFALPQINKARVMISKLFQRRTAMTEDTIVHLIKRINPLMDEEFIYLAIDQLIGKPPYIAPKKIRDKYNRLGYIINSGRYYVFQPWEIEDKEIPLDYRIQPLKIKKASVTILPTKEVADKISSQEITHNLKFKIDGDILQKTYIDKYRTELTTFKPSDDPVAYINYLINIRYDMDRLTLKEQEFIVHNVISHAYLDNEAVDNTYTILAAILEMFYKDMHLLHRVEGDGHTYIVTLFDTDEYYYTIISNEVPNREWDSFPIPTGLITSVPFANDMNKLLPPLSNSHPDADRKLTTNIHYQFGDPDSSWGLCGTIGTTTKRSKGTIRQGDTISKELINEAHKKLMKYLNMPGKDINSLKFKIIDKTSERNIKTQSAIMSKRSEVSGAVCAFKQKESISDIMRKIRSVLENVLFENDESDDRVTPITLRDSGVFLNLPEHPRGPDRDRSAIGVYRVFNATPGLPIWEEKHTKILEELMGSNTRIDEILAEDQFEDFYEVDIIKKITHLAEKFEVYYDLLDDDVKISEYDPTSTYTPLIKAFDVQGGARSSMCIKMEKCLRFLELIKFKDRKWFLSPFEHELYIDIKDNDEKKKK